MEIDKPNHEQVGSGRLEANRLLVALDSVAQILSTGTDQQVMLGEVLANLEEGLGLSRGTVMLRSADGQELRIDVTSSGVYASQETVGYRVGEGITGRVLQTGEPAVIPRLADEPTFQDRIHRRREHEAPMGALGFVCVPIRVDESIVGTMAFDVPNANAGTLPYLSRSLSIAAAMIARDVKARRTAKIQRGEFERETSRLREALQDTYRPENIVGNSHAMREVYRRIKTVAPSMTTVLIRGESGTGKELVASAIHYAGKRADKPFVRVNCAALNENLLESELFGHERGAFTGAVQERVGRLEEAEGGTLFLDEIGDFSPLIQVKILRVLQEKEYSRVGSNTVRKADVRIVAATNRDLEEAIKTGAFRQDLYYRINVFPIILPPLRERREDVILLADHFVGKYAGRNDVPVPRISTTAINMMFAYHWPGNVRELENCIEHAMLLVSDDTIHGHMLPPSLLTPKNKSAPVAGAFTARVEQLERDLIVDALKRNDGNVAAAARELGITPRQVRYKIKRLRIDTRRIFGA